MTATPPTRLPYCSMMIHVAGSRSVDHGCANRRATRPRYRPIASERRYVHGRCSDGASPLVFPPQPLSCG
ncbi:hypothetical protein VTG60DRAFT_2337 [Thermothelomyces hinnuleus]